MAEDENININLVLEVEKYPCLYNTSLATYSRKTETDKAWAEIGKTMKMTGAACKEKWRNLRVVYLRHLKPSPSGSGKKRKKPYYLLDYMQFLTPYVKTMIPLEAGNFPSTSSTEDTEAINNSTTTDNISNYANSEHEIDPTVNTDDNSIQPSPKSKKKKAYSLHETDNHFINYLKQKSSQTESQTSDDAVMSFLKSLAPELREMNLQQFKIFKRKALSLIDDILNPPTTAVATTINETCKQEDVYY